MGDNPIHAVNTIGKIIVGHDLEGSSEERVGDAVGEFSVSVIRAVRDENHERPVSAVGSANVGYEIAGLLNDVPCRISEVVHDILNK